VGVFINPGGLIFARPAFMAAKLNNGNPDNF
jgi:hypothetical protein